MSDIELTNMLNEKGWVVVKDLDTVYEFNTFQKAFDFQLTFLGHLMTRWYYDMHWKPERLRQN
jgi:hypothetical protein